MKRLMIGAIMSMTLAGVLLYLFLSSHDSEVLLARNATLITDWKELYPPRLMVTSGQWSELYVEMLNIHRGPDNTYVFEDGSRIRVEGYLTSSSGEKFNLDAILSIGGFGLTKVMRLSNPALEWKHRDYKFRTLTLRANRDLKVGKIVWISYDPQSTKAGTKIPDVFLRD